MFYIYSLLIFFTLINLISSEKNFYMSYFNDLSFLINSEDEPVYQKCDNCIGIEMEIGFNKPYANISKWNNFINSNINENIKWKDMINLKYDPSVPNGIELNFQPMKYQIIKKINWKYFFDLINSEDCFSDLDTGLHLHISGEKNIYKIADFLFKNKNILINFMKRENPYYSYYCNYRQFKNNKLCIDKFAVINYHKYLETIEIRGFKMPINHILFIKYIDFMNMLDVYSNNKTDENELLKFLDFETNNNSNNIHKQSNSKFYKLLSYTIIFIILYKKIEKFLRYLLHK